MKSVKPNGNWKPKQVGKCLNLIGMDGMEGVNC